MYPEPHLLEAQIWGNSGIATFSFDWLLLWGGRYAPAVAAGEWWRWVTSLLLHQSFSHLLSNLVRSGF